MQKKRNYNVHRKTIILYLIKNEKYMLGIGLSVFCSTNSKVLSARELTENYNHNCQSDKKNIFHNFTQPHFL